MIAIVERVTPKDEEVSKEAIVKIAGGIEKEVKELLRCGLQMVFFCGF